MPKPNRSPYFVAELIKEVLGSDDGAMIEAIVKELNVILNSASDIYARRWIVTGLRIMASLLDVGKEDG